MSEKRSQVSGVVNKVSKIAVFVFAVLCMQRAAHAQLPFDPATDTNYLIIEGTKGERFAAGSDDNVLRWDATGGQEQRWQFVKSDKYPGRYKIRSWKYIDGTKVLDVQPTTGNVSIYPDNGQTNQTFTFLKLLDPIAQLAAPDLYNKYHSLGVDFVWINEWSRDGTNRVAIGSNGRAVRWGASMDNTQVFILVKEPVDADVEHHSYDFPLYKFDPNAKGDNKYVWQFSAPPFTRKIYNPLDGGVLLEYKQTDWPGNSDGCSAGGEPGGTVFREACFAHDADYEAPFDKAGFPTYKSGVTTGKELADYIFLKDMLLIAKGMGDTQNLFETVAYTFYRAVEDSDLAKYRGGSATQEIVNKGGVIAVKNKTPYPMVLRVKWTGPQGGERVEQIVNSAGMRAAVIPISIDSKNIEVKCWAGSQEIFTKNFDGPGMYAFTAKGAQMVPKYEDGLQD
jgi:hypothetical protein